MISGLEGRGDLFSEGRNIYPPEAGKIFLSSSTAPKAVIRGLVQAGKATSAQAAISWGCAVKSSGAKLPFDGMRQDFAAL
jgi:hypothetical protein